MPVKPNPKSSLQRTMILYFLLVGFACLLVGVEFIMDTRSRGLKQELQSNLARYSNREIDAKAVFSPIDKLRNKAVLMVVIILTVMVIVLTMFIKRITEPLQHMIGVAREISGGNLGCTIRIDSKNELAELAGVINEMSSNLQEVLLLAGKLCASFDSAFRDASLPLNGMDRETLAEKIIAIGNNAALLSELLDCFQFYETGEGAHD